MSELKQPIIKLRQFVNMKQFIQKTEPELRDQEIKLKELAQEALLAWEDKAAAAQFWNDQFTGNYGD